MWYDTDLDFYPLLLCANVWMNMDEGFLVGEFFFGGSGRWTTVSFFLFSKYGQSNSLTYKIFFCHSYIESLIFDAIESYFFRPTVEKD